MVGSDGSSEQESGQPLRFVYPDVGPRYDPGEPDRPRSGLRSGRNWLRIVAVLLLVGMGVLALLGRSDAAAGVGWLLLGPLVVVMLFVEVGHVWSDHVWDGDT